MRIVPEGTGFCANSPVTHNGNNSVLLITNTSFMNVIKYKYKYLQICISIHFD